jgi:hypothetical protein
MNRSLPLVVSGILYLGVTYFSCTGDFDSLALSGDLTEI